MGLRFERNRRVTDQVKREPSYEASLRRLAAEVRDHAKDAAPVETGAYRDSIKAEGSIVYTDDPFGHLVEFGSANNPAYAPLRRGAQAAGLRLDDPKQ